MFVPKCNLTVVVTRSEGDTYTSFMHVCVQQSDEGILAGKLGAHG
jgi:hypothetical protein